MIRKLWGQKLTEIVMSIQEPNWEDNPEFLAIMTTPEKIGPITLIEDSGPTF
jgi:putative proteasome-type protease